MNIKNLVLAIFFSMALISSILLLLQYHHHNPYLSTPNRHKSQPDIYVTDATFSDYDKNGLLKYHLKTPKALHFPEENVTAITQPNMVVYTNQRVPWRTTSDKGLLKRGKKIIYLSGNVVIHQIEQINNPETIIKTNQLTIFPDRSFADTNQNVTIIRPFGELQSRGMTLNYKKGVLLTKAQTRGVYVSNDTPNSASQR